MSGWTVIFGLVLTVLASLAAWRFAPKQDTTVWRSSLILTFSMFYLMWAITYLVQLHPLEAPIRSDLRSE